MFVIEFDDSARVLRNVVNILKERIPEGTLAVKSDGIFLQTMDSSHVALADLIIYPQAASSYTCDDMVHELGIPMASLAKIFNCRSSSGTCRLSYNEVETPDILDLQFGSNGNVISYMLKLIDGSYNEINIPEDNIPEYQQTISASQFQHNLKDLSSFADTISIQPNENELVFFVTGDGVNATFRMEMLESDADSGEFTEPSSFSLAYLQWFAKAAALTDDVLIAVGAPLPMLVQFTEEDVFKLRFFLSPKIADIE